MSERKVLNKYYPPDFDPSKIPRMKLPKNRQYTVRLMAPFNMRCKTCGEYIYKGKKFNARKEDVENQDYLGIRIYRFYIKCTRCLQEISFKTDPRNCDYEIEAGATRNFMALKLAEEQAQREEDELREEEANNPMKLLENRTIQSKNEIELLESLEELKDLNKRHQAVDYDSMLQQYDTRLSAQEIEERLKQRDEDFIKTVKFSSSQKRKVVVEEEIIEEEMGEPSNKAIKTEEECETVETEVKKEPEVDPLIDSTEVKPQVQLKSNSQNWNRSVATMSRKSALSGLVRLKKSNTETAKTNEEVKKEVTEDTQEVAKQEKSQPEIVVNQEIKKAVTEDTQVTKQEESNRETISNGLLLLGAYSGSDTSDSD